MIFTCSVAFAQERTVSGKVTSMEDGGGLPGVNVMLKGSNIGTTTDLNGSYRISIPSAGGVLIFSFIGLATEEVNVGSRSIIDVSMKNDLKQLSEVVVTGYATQTQREVVGSVTAINARTISEMPMATFDQALQGRAPGVLIQAQSGQPGAAANVLIRGRGSVLGSNNPLFILDGIEISAGDFATLNQNDFESISVLKDAISTSQYGSRGANGVIVITTKKGQTGKAKLNYDVQTGFSRAPINRLELMNSAEKLEYELANGNPYDWTPAELEDLKKIETNWEDVFFKVGRTTNHTLSVSGASDKTSYFLSGAVLDQSGTVPTTGLKRYTGRANLESSAGDFTFGVNSSLGFSNFTNTSESNTGIATPLNAIRWTNPYEKPYVDDEKTIFTEMVSGQPNALQELLSNRNLRGQLKGVGNVYVNYSVPFVKGLSLRTNWGADYTSNESSRFVDPTTYSGQFALGNKGSFSRVYGKRFRYTGTTSATYATSFGSDHTLSVALFNEVVKSNANSFFFTGYGMGGPFQNESGITPGNATNGFIPAVGGNAGDGNDLSFEVGGESALLSYFTMINYGFKDRYFISAGVRRDGSSRFGANKRYANFGSIGFSWIVSDEAFLSSLKGSILNELKLKVSYGSSGNQAGIGSFQARELYSRSVYNGISGLGQFQLANPELQWERKTIFNSGIEATTFNGRIKTTVEFYNSLTTDLFLPRQLSRTTGYSSITSNIGELQNRGVEFLLEGDLIKAGGFSWSANASLTYNKNEVKKLVGDQKEIISGLTVNRVGEQMNSLYLVRYVGVNPQNGNAQYLNKDGELTETYSAADRVIVGSFETPFFGGFGSTLRFKGLELNGFFSFVKGNQVFNNDRVNVEDPSYLWDNLSRDLLNEWRTPGQVTNIPRSSQQMRSGTTRFVENGDFLRLRNISLSYSLPKSLLSNISVNSLRFFAQGQNLLTWTQFRGFDPEIATGSLTGAQYPALRTVTFGVNVGL
jgi:TonB-dependent starch-binding outer membrane protein SusC